MAETVIVTSKAGHVLEMNRMSFDEVWGPKGRKGGYELATDEQKDEDGNFVLTPLELGLPEGKETLADVGDDHLDELFRNIDPSMQVPPTAAAVDLTEKLTSSDDAAPSPAPTSNTAGTGASSGAARQSSVDTAKTDAAPAPAPAS